MKIIFAGSPAIAVPSLEALSKTSGIEIAGVLTNPDTPKGRQGAALPTEVGDAAARIGGAFPVLKPLKLDADARERVSALKPDLLVSFAYGHIFGPKFLALFPKGGINIHASLLPKHRGPSPIQAAILNRDTVTGIAIQTLAHQMDCGDILAQRQLQLTGRETTASLGLEIAQIAAEMLPPLLLNIKEGKVSGTPQNHSEASYCSLFKKTDGLINWTKSAAEIDARIRAFDPWPLCRTIHNGKELLILKAALYLDNTNLPDDKNPKKAGQVLGIDKNDGILIQTGEKILAVTKLQYQGKKALLWQDFLNGARGFTGSQLG